jgi:hypothetical protein
MSATPLAERDDGVPTPATGEVIDSESPPPHGAPWPLRPGAPVGQTFRARAGGLCAIEVLVAVDAGAVGELWASLHADSPEGVLLHTQALPVSTLASGRYARFAFPPLADSAGRRFYVRLGATAPGLAVSTAGPAGLGDGTLYVGDAPTTGCLVLRTFAQADPRFDSRRQIERLLAERAELTRELLAARHTIQRLRDERTTLRERLRSLLARLAPTGTGDGSGHA